MLIVERGIVCPPEIDLYVRGFAANFEKGKVESASGIGLSGRILRGKGGSDFLTLSPDPARKVVFMFDGQALGNFVGLTGRQMLREAGYPDKDISKLVKEGTVFKLALFGETAAPLANWDNLLKATEQAYPELREDIGRSAEILKSVTYTDAIAIGGAVGRARQFLHTTLNVNRLYTGTGYTPGGHKEYVALNQPLDNLGPHALIRFPISQ